MRRLAIALILIAGCSESTPRQATPAAPQASTPIRLPAQQPIAPPAPKIDRASLRKELTHEFQLLIAGKESNTFYQFGFAPEGPHYQWLQRIHAKMESMPRGEEQMAVGLLRELALEYHASRGASTERTRHWTSELMDTIGRW